jgi:multicomponent Na+:H+ antiporter subunit E
VETKGDTFYIHWIDARAKNIEESTKAIVEKFERYLEVIFG